MDQNYSQINFFVQFCHLSAVVIFFVYITHQNFEQVTVLGEFCQASTTLQFVYLRYATKICEKYIFGAALQTLTIAKFFSQC